MTLRHGAFGLFVSLFLGACGSTEFKATNALPRTERVNGGGSQQTPPAKDQSSGDATRRPDGESRSGGELGNNADGLPNDDENQIADVPANVSGAFLTCATMYQPGQQDGSERVFGCAVSSPRTTKVDMRAHQMRWSFKSLDGKDMNAAVRTRALADTAPYHVEITVPANMTEALKAVADVDWSWGGHETLSSGQLGTPDATRPVYAYRLGVTDDFHVGDDRFDASACKPMLEQHQIVGEKVQTRFEVAKNGTKLAITLAELCGLDSASHVNEVIVEKDGVVLRRERLLPAMGRFVLSELTLDAGLYSLRLVSNARRSDGDHDNFVVGDIYFQASTVIKVGQVKAVAP